MSGRGWSRCETRWRTARPADRPIGGPAHRLMNAMRPRFRCRNRGRIRRRAIVLIGAAFSQAPNACSKDASYSGVATPLYPQPFTTPSVAVIRYR